MKIVHVLFDDYPYISDWGYQENDLAKIEVSRNEDVTIIAGAYIPKILKNILTKKDVENCSFYDKYGVKIVRLKCKFSFNNFLMTKLKKYEDFYLALESENPNLIFIHDLHALSLFEVSKYKRNHPNVKIIADIHINFSNSANNFLSKYILHKMIYKYIIKKNISCIDKLYYLDVDCKKFYDQIYKIKKEMHFLPLGGNLIDIKQKEIQKQAYLNKNELPEDAVIFFHSGKLTLKKRTIELIEAFHELNISKFYLIIAGKMDDEVNEKIGDIIVGNSHINYLGWMSQKDLDEFMIIADFFLQPGTPSVSVQNAMCKGCGVMLFKHKSFYRDFIDDKDCIYIESKNDIKSFFKFIEKQPEQILYYQTRSFSIAKDIFDYKKQAKIIEDVLNEI